MEIYNKLIIVFEDELTNKISEFVHINKTFIIKQDGKDVLNIQKKSNEDDYFLVLDEIISLYDEIINSVLHENRSNEINAHIVIVLTAPNNEQINFNISIDMMKKLIDRDIELYIEA